MTNNNKIKKFTFPFLILIVALALTFSLKFFEPEIIKAKPHEIVNTVNVVKLSPQTKRLDVSSHAVVIPRTQARLVPEVAGQVEKASPKWHNGGFFKKGEVMLQIEQHQYKNRVANARASVARTKSAYVQEQGQAYVAEKEWERRERKSSSEAAKALALRKPQLESAKAQYEAALADLEAAEISLKKTSIHAPFAGIVLKKSADVGQNVSTGQALAEFVAIDYAEVRVPLTQAKQYLIDLPRLKNQHKTEVEVIANTAKNEERYQGYLVRTEGVLDEKTKVLYGVVEIKDPYQLLAKADKKPLRLGSYVEVRIPGREIDGLYVLPENALRRGNAVWVVDDEGILRSKTVELLGNYNNELIVYKGLSGDVNLVVGSVGKAMHGKKVEINESQEQAPSDKPVLINDAEQ